MSEISETCILVTGTNGGLGFAICCRLTDEFLQTRPQTQKLTIIITTRSQEKSNETIRKLEEHLERFALKADGKLPGIGAVVRKRVRYDSQVLDLNSLVAVKTGARAISSRFSKIDVVILNAGFGGWTGIHWGQAIGYIVRDWFDAMTFPAYKLSEPGSTTRPQLPRRKDGTVVQEPPIGDVFCSNVFGHYMLCHYLMPLLWKSESGRIIAISSLEAYGWAFSLGDFQALQSRSAYESVKRLTDALALTSGLQATAPWVDRFLSPSSQGLSTRNGDGTDSTTTANRPRIYLAHPGVCATSIMTLPWILSQGMLIAFFITRLLGSIWHTVFPYSGACAPTWLALSSQELLDYHEASDGPAKWGSATSQSGDERVERTEVEGWGFGGFVDDERLDNTTRRGRPRDMKRLTKEGLQEFIALGRECWQEMESLREEWEKRLEDAGV